MAVRILTLVTNGATAADVELIFALDAPQRALDVVVLALGQKIDLDTRASSPTYQQRCRRGAR